MSPSDLILTYRKIYHVSGQQDLPVGSAIISTQLVADWRH